VGRVVLTPASERPARTILRDPGDVDRRRFIKNGWFMRFLPIIIAAVALILNAEGYAQAVTTGTGTLGAPHICGVPQGGTKTVVGKDEEGRKVITKYNDAKLEVERTVYSRGNSQYSRIVWTLSVNGFETTETYDGRDKLLAREKYFYLKPRKPDRVVRYHPDGTLWVTTQYIYDSKGKNVGIKVMDASGRDVPIEKMRDFQIPE